ncbi:MAG: thioredoxin domain-containing protein [Planctomycetota bacterium]|nr:thioredoxin domain-containing protein [Planctomycetota bacterium]
MSLGIWLCGGGVALALSAALVGQGEQTPSVAPKQHRVVNRLSKSSSPYLRLHQHNPVDWFPWGEEALARAKELDRPIFLSIGYSACHWCHVMAAESFADPETAKLLNEEFVCIKVDREERPDLDQLYMGALQAMGKRGGWPLSAWLTPTGEPFYGGTYFPPEDRDGLPGFARLCGALAKAWAEDREAVVKGAGELAAHLERVLAPKLVPGEPTDAIFAAVVPAARALYDDRAGGFASPPRYAPKFPQPAQLAMLLRHEDAAAREMAYATLDAMRRGGIHDQLGGGFHRYSTDRAWVVPHFEKMLYDNAALASVYLEAGAARGDQRLLSVGAGVLDYLMRELRSDGGAFWSSQDAQSDGGEGRYYVWTRAQFDAVLGEAAERVRGVFGVTERGNWEGRNVLTMSAERPDDADFATSCAALLAAREQRPRPPVDDKVLVAWNGLAIEAFCAGYRLLGEHRYLDAGKRAGRFLLAKCVDRGRVLRSWHAAGAGLPGFLEDHAALANGLLSLFECDGDPLWLSAAREVLSVMGARFGAADGSFYFCADDHEQLLARAKRADEGATPSGVAMAARALLRAGSLLGDSSVYERGVAVLRAHHALLAAGAAAAPSLMSAAQFHLARPVEVVVAGPPADPRTQALLAVAWRATRMGVVVAPLHASNAESLEGLSPVFRGKWRVDIEPCAYVCRRGTCKAPVTDAALLARALAGGN